MTAETIKMIFYIFTRYKVEAYENKLQDFIADDLFFAIQNCQTKIATSEEAFLRMKEENPGFHIYKIKIDKKV